MGRESGSDPYRRLFEIMLDGAIVVDATTARIVLANKAAATIFGFSSPDSLVGLDPLDYIPQEDRDHIVQLIASNIEGKQENPAEVRVVTKDKRHIWVSATATATDFEGHTAMMATMRDITSEKEKHAALREADESKIQLMDAASEAIVIVQDGKMAYVNPAMARGAGMSRQGLIGLPIIEIVHPDSRQDVIERYERLNAGHFFPVQVTVKGIGAQGRTKWSNIQDIPFSWQGRPAVMSLITDVTDKVLAEQLLKEREERLRTIMENAWDGVIIFDDNYNVIFESPSLARITGYTPQEWTGCAPTQWPIHPDDMASAASALEKLRNEPGTIISSIRLRIICKDGSWRWVEASGRNLLHDPKVKGIVTNFRDITESKEAEETLRASEEKYRFIVDSTSDFIWTLDLDLHTTYASPSVERILGFTPKERLGQDVTHQATPESAARAKKALMEHLALEQDPKSDPHRTVTIEMEYYRKDGTTIWLENQIGNIRDADGRLVALHGVSRDVSDRRQAEQALRESEERYRLLAENVSDVIWVTDMNLKPTYISPSSARMLGYSSEQVMSGSLQSMLTPESAKAALKAFSRALARESELPGAAWNTPTLDLEMLRADGSTIWTAANFSYIRGADGKPVAMLGILRDISERKKAEDSLRRSEERFRSLVETSSDWVWEIDARSRYTYVSPKVRDILGYEPQELLTHSPFEYMHQREARRVSRIMRRFAAGRLPFSLLENTATHKDGHAVVLESSAIPIMDGSGHVLGYRGINRDTTERKKVEQELQRSLKRLEKTMESTIEAITTTIETRDPYTTGHQMRVTDLACAIAKVMEIPPGRIEGIRVAGLLHDIGKIAVPTEILSKPGKLNEVEYEMIKTHAKIGYNILKKIEFPWPVARTVLQHHERWNGSGYPYGIRSEDILLEARILAVADVMEAMSSHRPYRPSIGADKALDEITKNSGILYDPAVATACIRAFAESGFEFTTSLRGNGESEIAPSELHVHYSLEDH